MKNKKAIKYSIILYTGILSVLGLCQFLGIPNLDTASRYDRMLLGATIWWLGVAGVIINVIIAIRLRTLRTLAIVLLMLCIVFGLVGGFHYYLAVNWKWG